MTRVKQLLPGDLIKVIYSAAGWTLAHDPLRGAMLAECPRNSYKYNSLEGKLGLILGIKTNKLDQPLAYHIEIEKEKYICKAILATKYFYKL